MAADGIEIVVATPHVRDDYPTTPEGMTEALARVREAVAQAGIEIDVRGGGEIALDRLERLDPEALARFGLGGNPRLVLLEYPYYGRPLFLARECARLQLRGIVPVIAHPERNQTIQDRPTDLDAVVQEGAVVQLTAASVDGRLGRSIAVCAHRLLELELAHVIASDAHAPGVRQASLSGAVGAVGGGDLGRWLTHDVPAALLVGQQLPSRPASSRRHRGLSLRRRG
jgi:protein-tyrosine phosphatase